MNGSDLLNAVLIGIILVPLVGGALTTAGRVAWYFRHREARPRLLSRDVVVIGGLAFTVVLIFGARVFRILGFDTSGLATSVPWILATTLPVVAALWTYFLYELFVVERGTGGRVYRERQNGERDHE